MKNILQIIIISLVLFLSASKINAQDITISGKQIKSSGNIQYIGASIYVSQESRIVNFIGPKTSFSLRIDNYNKYQFYFNNNKFTPPLESIIIEPGMYTLYPDLIENKDSIEIKVVLRAVK